MAKTLSLRAGESRTISKDTTDNPKLCEKRLSDGRTSLYLQYYLGYRREINPDTGKESIKVIRQKESLNLYLYSDPRTPGEREHNKNVVEVAKRIRYEREQMKLEAGAGYRVKRKTETDFLRYFENFVNNYTKKDKHVMQAVYKRFVDFLSNSPKYKLFATGIQPRQITREMVEEFTEYLKTRSHGGGAATFYGRFKSVVNRATDDELFAKNPCKGVSMKIDNTLTKSILTLDEIKALISTPFPNKNTDIRRAFLFTLYTGIRFCDLNNLTFGNVDYSRQVLTFTQQKTEGHSAHSAVTIPLNANTLSLIGDKRGNDEKIFNLYCFQGCLAIIRKWAKTAGIDKHLTWHCARHSFAVNLLNNGANIKTVSSLLGHSSISMTERYLHAVDELKRAAVDSLPDINL